MRLRELFEAGNRHVTFVFGRMNPPTIGHKQLLDTAKSVGGDYKIFLSQTQDAKKNPLDYATKINFVKKMFPEHAAHIVDDAGLNTVVAVASHLYDLGYRDATFVAGSDRIDAMSSLLKQYNGVEGKAHGFYKFDVLDFKSSGEREDGAEGVAGISASGARAAAANNDFEAFKEATGAGQYADELYKAVRAGMGIQEDVSSFVKTVDVDIIHAIALREHLLLNPNLFEDREDFQTMRKFLDANITPKPDVNQSYVYSSIQTTPGINFVSIAHFSKPYKLVEIKDDYAYFNINGNIKRFPESGKLSGDSLSQLYFFKSLADLKKFNTLLKMKFSEYKFSSRLLDQNNIEETNYGRYWCSTDKKWKTRKGPKQKRAS